MSKLSQSCKHDGGWQKPKLVVALTQWLGKPLAPFVFLLCVSLLIHLQLTLGTGDDVMNKTMLDGHNLWLRLYDMYDKWSSRQLVDAVMYLVFLLPYAVWRVLNATMLTLCAFLMARLLQIAQKPTYTWALVGLMLSFEWVTLSSAGWVTTMLNFLWPFTAVLVAMQPYVTHAQGKRRPKWQYPLYGLLFLYGMNMEQLLVMGSLLLAVYLGVVLYSKRKLYWYLPMQLILCGVSYLYVLTCPGVPRRMAGEMTAAFQDFMMRSLWQKIELGLANGFSRLMYYPNNLFFLFCLLLALCIWGQYQSKLYRLMAVIPLACVSVLGLCSETLNVLLPPLSFFRNALTPTGMITVATAGTPKRYVSFLLLCVLFSLCIVNLYLALGHTRDSVVGIALLCAGFSSHAMMGFSASIWTSGLRTAYFCNMALVAVCMLLFIRHAKPKQRAWQLAQVAIWVCALTQCVSLIQ